MDDTSDNGDHEPKVTQTSEKNSNGSVIYIAIFIVICIFILLYFSRSSSKSKSDTKKISKLSELDNQSIDNDLASKITRFLSKQQKYLNSLSLA
jgi:uncharacterized membrane protein